MKRPVICVAGVVAAFLVSTSTGVAVAGADAPAGNRAAIGLYARSEAVNARYQEISFVGHGARYGVGKGPNDILYALAFAPRGSKPASDRVSVIQRAGKVVEEVDRCVRIKDRSARLAGGWHRTVVNGAGPPRSHAITPSSPS